MRNVSDEFNRRLNAKKQTLAENTNPSANVKITRNIIPLTYSKFLESRTISSIYIGDKTILDCDVAVAHPKFKKPNSEASVAYVLSDGSLHVICSPTKEALASYSWLPTYTDYEANASACAIGYDSDVKKNISGEEEFVTQNTPWVFWISDGELLGYQINTNTLPVSLVQSNATDVSVIRGPSGSFGAWDFGLTVFFAANNVLFYRQLIDGVWYDAEVVNTSTIEGDIVKISAFNTWDYRVGLQILDDTGKLYCMYTYTEGIGTRNAEHIELNMSAVGTLTKIQYHDAKSSDEHIELTMSAYGYLTYGLSAIPLSAYNIKDANDNWGTTIQVTFDYPITDGRTTTNMFTLVDANGNNYICEGFEIDDTGYVLTLTFADFNLAGLYDNVTVSYTKPTTGGLMSPAIQTDSFEETFVPENLVPPASDPPTFDYAETNEDGSVIYLYMTEPVTNADVSGMTSNFTVSLREYNYAPGGSLQNTTRTVKSMQMYDGTVMSMSSGTLTNVEIANNELRLEADLDG